MQLIKIWRIARIASILALVFVGIPYAVTAQNSVVSTTVSGQLNEQFAKHYLGLQVIDTGQPVVIKMSYDPQDSQTLDDGSGFYVFKQAGFDQYVNAAPPSETAFSTSSLETMDGIKRKVSDIGASHGSTIVTLVVYNDTTTALSYTLTGENVRFVDDSGSQVVSGSTPAPAATPVPVAETPAAAAAPVAAPTSGEVKSTWVRGQLNEQFAKHYLGLEVIDEGQPVTIKMSYDPQDSQQLDDSSGFHLFTEAGFQQYAKASPPSESSIGSGSLETMDGIKRKVADIVANRASTIVTLVTYNDTTTPISYTLTGENIKFIDASGEQVEGDRMAAPAPQTADGTAADETAAPAPAGTDITPGGSYTVQTGDTLGSISNRAYGTTGYWSAICSANSLASCDHIEVGVVLTIPTAEQAAAHLGGSGATPAPTEEAMPEQPAEMAPEVTPEATPEPTEEAMPEPTAEAMPEPTAEADTGLGNLIDVAEGYEELDILLLALDLAGLSATISDGGPYTIFAPTNAAFASLPEARLDMLMADSSLLAETLKYHVVSGTLTAADLGSQSSLTTLEGSEISIGTSDDGTLQVEGVSIVTSDVAASNGVIHFIHQLLPEPEQDGDSN
jgi:uncharacterized surface protein with fasciclin (FAS1) repeats